MNPDWSHIKLVVFDVDGTLYDQKALRIAMTIRLCGYYLFHPWQINELRIIATYRKLREQNTELSEESLDEAQYEWVAKSLNVPVDKVKKVILRWIDQAPLKILPRFKYSGVNEFFDALKDNDIKVAIFSDLPVAAKLSALGLNYNLAVCSTDPEINHLKPDPAGLNHILQHYNLAPDQCLFIGDRQDRDGEAAIRAGVTYLIKSQSDKRFFLKLLDSLNQNK